MLLAAVPTSARQSGEGALQNDTSLIVDDAASAEFARGDELAAALDPNADPAALDARAWSVVFDAWRQAARLAPSGALVAPLGAGDAVGATNGYRWRDEEGTASPHNLRRAEGVEWALLRRVAGLSPALRALWRERFAAGASLEAEDLASTERLYPGTPAAFRAALGSCDLELERGSWRLARAQWERAERQLGLVDDAPATWRAALEERAAWLERESGAEEAQQPWRTAKSLELAHTIPLVDLSALDRAQRALLGRGPQTGAAWIDGAHVFVQSTQPSRGSSRARGEDHLALVDAASGALVWSSSLFDLGAQLGIAFNAASVGRDHPGWPHRPLTCFGARTGARTGRVVFVARSVPSAIVCLEFSAPFAAPPRVVWAWIAPPAGQPVWRTSAERTNDEPIDPALCDAGVRFEPGPAWVDDVLLVQTRAAEQEPLDERRQAGVIRAALVAIDARDGRPLWKRDLARGTEAAREGSRFTAVSATQSAAAPLCVRGTRVLAATNLGSASSIDALDGRVDWALRTRQRGKDARGFAGTLSVACPDEPCFLVGSADSDRLYFLRAGPDLGRGGASPPRTLEGLFLAPPLAIAQAEGLIGGSARGALLLSRAGALRTLAEWDVFGGVRREAVHSSSGEYFTGSGLTSKARAFYTTDRGLWLVDLERELFLLDYAAVPGELPFGGEVTAQGARVLVLGPHALWVFSAAD